MTKSNLPRPPVIRAYFDEEREPFIVADNFAGGGGASTGLAQVFGGSPQIAINHDPEAIEIHRANHPDTHHYCESVFEVDPRVVTAGHRVRLAWFSPDCTHFSQAKGGKPRAQKIRGLAWIAVSWAQRVRPDVIALENVREFESWGPLHRKGPKAGQPIAARAGETFRAFVGKLRRLGYVVEWRLLRAADYGAPTKRVRFFLVARRDGKAIQWPTPTHGPGRARPWRTAAEFIDWSIPCPSIFDRKKPLADKTHERIARGMRKFVLEAARPFIVPVKTWGGGGNNPFSIDEPMRTITTSKRGEFAVAVPYLVHRSNGERKGQAPRIYDVQEPLGTIVAQGEKHGLMEARLERAEKVAVFLAKHYGHNKAAGSGFPGGAPVDEPAGAITARDHHSLVTAHLIKFQGTSEAHLEASAHSLEEPVPTITAGGWKLAQVAAFLVRYNGTGDSEDLQMPLPTLTTKPRFALVTVTIGGEEYVVVDIGMRMLTPRELYLLQGFPPAYQIEPTVKVGAKTKTLSKTAQIRMCGNSVPPHLARAVAAAQFPEYVQEAA